MSRQLLLFTLCHLLPHAHAQCFIIINKRQKSLDTAFSNLNPGKIILPLILLLKKVIKKKTPDKVVHNFGKPDEVII